MEVSASEDLSYCNTRVAIGEENEEKLEFYQRNEKIERRCEEKRNFRLEQEIKWEKTEEEDKTSKKN